ncbi:MAG: hydrogenase maturation nickel metallochaperone HypA [Candidatus Bathyarchaeota archaeon]|nr:hydrogenase maturation nickel metallochaperone HypA [Candidatus Bathyarchaeota archaeon]
MSNRSNNQTAVANKIATYLLLICLIILSLSFVALTLSLNAFFTGDVTVGAFLGFTGFVAMALSMYFLFQSKRTISMKIETPKVMTTIDCGRCGKTVREYQRGDYVFKEGVACPKCGNKEMITAIYKEVKEKEKTYNI